MQEKQILSFWLRLWRGVRYGTRAYIDDRQRSPGHRWEWPFKFAAWHPTFFAILMTGLFLIGSPDLSVFGSGGPAFFSFFCMPFMLISYLFLRQQKMIEELRARLEKDQAQRPESGES